MYRNFFLMLQIITKNLSKNKNDFLCESTNVFKKKSLFIPSRCVMHEFGVNYF